MAFWLKFPLQGEENGGEGGSSGGGAGGAGDGSAGAGAGGAGDGEHSSAGSGGGSGAGDGAGGNPDGGVGTWPTDWRNKLSGDEKHAKTLERFDSPSALFNSYLALRQKVDSGELRSAAPYPDKGTAEEQVAWRKAHGIPESAADYSKSFSDGLVIGENDKEAIDGFLKVAHETNATPQQVDKMLHWYYDQQERNMAIREEMDAKYLQESEDTLRAEWGGDFRTNINLMKGMIETLPESVRDLFLNARLGDGSALVNHPDMARWMVNTARTLNPVHTVVPGAGANAAGAIDDEISQIEKVMREDRSRYNGDEKMQARLRQLYEARERAKA